MSKLLLLGAGGHGKVVAEAAMTMQKWKEIAFLDDQYPELSECISWPVIGKLNEYTKFAGEYNDISVSLGNNKLRMKCVDDLQKQNHELAVIIHASAIISPTATIQSGTVVLANCVVNSSNNIGSGCILNTAVSVDHDCNIFHGVHISPGVKIGGNVEIGDLSWLGIGSTVINDIKIGSNSIVGAGAVVIDDVKDGATVIGCPARPIVK